MSVFMVSVDPGKFVCGVALWKDAFLVRACLVTTPENRTAPLRWLDLSLKVRSAVDTHLPGVRAMREDLHLLVEQMQVYGKDGAEKSEDLLDLMGVAGAIVGGLPECRGDSVLPSVWKGQVPRDVLAARERAKWAQVDYAGPTKRILLPEQKKTQADVLAAVSLGRWWWKQRGQEVR